MDIDSFMDAFDDAFFDGFQMDPDAAVEVDPAAAVAEAAAVGVEPEDLIGFNDFDDFLDGAGAESRAQPTDSQSPSTVPTPSAISDTPSDSCAGAGSASKSSAPKSSAPAPSADLRPLNAADLPPDVEAIRGFFFQPKAEVRYSKEEFDRHWTYCHNMWVTSRQPYPNKTPGLESQSFRCLLWQKVSRRVAPPAAAADGPAEASGPSRMKPSRVPIGCPATAKQVTYPDGSISWGPARNPKPHNHTLDEVDATRRNNFVLGMARQEVAMGYAPAAIFNTLTGHGGRHEATEMALRRVGGGWFRRQDVINAGAAFRKANPDARRVGHNFSTAEQMEQVVQFLGTRLTQRGERWYCKTTTAQRSVDGGDSPAIVFASAGQLNQLYQRGYLVLMDATHNTNWLNWLLYTLMVRTQHGSWLPVAHFLAEKGDANVAAAALQIVADWIRSDFERPGRDWPIRYFLTDDSAVEQKAVYEVFGQQVDHLLCSVHSERTLRRKFSGPRWRDCLNHLLAALKYRRTSIGCEESINAAIAAAERVGGVAGEQMAEYIHTRWFQRRHQWANYAREHSPLLLQVSSTNALEGYHSALKFGAKNIMPAFSLAGTVKHVVGVNQRAFARAERDEHEFRGKSVRDTHRLPGLDKFPCPVQVLMLPELREGITLADDGEPVRPDLLENVVRVESEVEDEEAIFEWQSAACECRFYRKWRLPCRHLFHHHFANTQQTLTPRRLAQWSDLWHGAGYDLYERADFSAALPPSTQRESPAQRVEVREVTEVLLSEFYELERAAYIRLGPVEGRSFVGWWIGKLRGAAASMTALNFDAWKAQS